MTPLWPSTFGCFQVTWREREVRGYTWTFFGGDEGAERERERENGMSIVTYAIRCTRMDQKYPKSHCGPGEWTRLSNSTRAKRTCNFNSIARTGQTQSVHCKNWMWLTFSPRSTRVTCTAYFHAAVRLKVQWGRNREENTRVEMEWK